jgi:HEAT repeat protein
MSFFPDLATRPLQALVQAFDNGPAPADAVPEEEIPLWLDEVAVALAAKGDLGLDALLARLAGADEVRARAALLALAFDRAEFRMKRLPELQRLLVSFLEDPRPNVAAEAVRGLTSLGCTDTVNRLLPLLGHESPYLVGSVLAFLSRHYPEAARPALLLALRSPDPIIRQYAVDELDELGYAEALPHLRRLLADPDADVRLAAQTAVANLEGHHTQSASS